MGDLKFVFYSEERIVNVRVNKVEQLIHIQEKLDEEVMTTMLKFDECLKLAEGILSSMENSVKRVG
jgi:hypothetical protein